MDPTLGEKQNNQPQQKRPAGESAINTINNFTRRGFTNPFGKVGSRVVAQAALRGFSALLASQAGLPILITLVFIVIFVIIIIGFGGAPPSQINQVINPTVTPTLAAP